MARIDETWHRLREWTLQQAPSERLAAQVISAEGWTGIDPVHPLGGPDGGKDALADRDGQRWVMAVYFPLGAVAFTQVKEKFLGDAAGVKANSADAIVFVCNQKLAAAERRTLRDAVDFPVEIYHLERVAHVLDRPAMAAVREQYLDIPAHEPADPEATLEEHFRASRADCAARWMAVGLPRDEARDLAADTDVGRPADALLPTPADPVAVWVGDLGSGKSIAAHRLHQAALARAREDGAAPCPVHLRAAAATGGLQAAVRTACAELGDVRARGGHVVVDAVDEVGFDAGRLLLEQARALVLTWPQTTVVLTTRPTMALADEPECRLMPDLDDDAQHEVVALGAGVGADDVRLWRFDGAVRDAVRRPMFALLAGLWLREHDGMPAAPIDLLAELGRRAAGLGADTTGLRALAIAAVARDFGPLPEADAGSLAQLDAVLATGLIVRRDGGLVFALPALAQWLAAQGVLEGELDTTRLLDAPEDLEVWRAPLALVVALGSAEQALSALAPLWHTEAGFAIRVLDEAFGTAYLEGGIAPPWREAGQQVRDALERLLGALGPAASLTEVADADGRPVPLAVSAGEDSVDVAFYAGDAPRDGVFAWPVDLGFFNAGPQWTRIRGAQVAPGATWAWRWALDVVRHDVKQLLNHRAFPADPDGPLAHEAMWGWATARLGRSTLRPDPVDLAGLLDDVDAALSRIGDGAVLLLAASPGEAAMDARAVAAWLRRRLDAGQTELAPPLPGPDQLDDSTGWISECFSPQRAAEVADALYRHVIDAYRDLVDFWLPALASRLEHRVLMPLQVTAELHRADIPGWGPNASLSGHLEALEHGPDDVSITLVDHPFRFDGDHGWMDRQRRRRPQAARWLSGSFGGMSFELGQQSAIADATYTWLSRDLQRIGLAQSLDGGGRRLATRWRTS